MSNMKIKIIVAIALFFATVSSQGQEKFRIGLRAGAGMYNLAGNYIFGHEEYKPVGCLYAGVFAEIPISPQFSFQSALLYVRKGGRGEYFLKSTYHYLYQLYYTELPINLIYKKKLKSGSIFGGLGTYIGIGLIGKVKQKYDNVTYTREIKFSNKWIDGEGIVLKPLDYGLNLMAGFEFEIGFSIGLYGQMGLANLNVDSWEGKSASRDSGISIRNMGFGLSFGYAVF
jgi:hypothetical protein